MATRVLQSVGNGLNQARNRARANGLVIVAVRGLSASNNRNGEDSWFKSLFVRKVDPRKDAHSHLLAKKEDNNLYKIQFHNVKPDCLDAYNKLCTSNWDKLFHQEYPDLKPGSNSTMHYRQSGDNFPKTTAEA